MGEYCDGLDQYLQKIWAASSSKVAARFNGIDYFGSKNFLNRASSLIVDNKQFENACYYLKKSSPLESNLTRSKIPDLATLTSIAKAHQNQEEYLAACDDFSKQSNIEYGAFHMNY